MIILFLSFKSQEYTRKEINLLSELKSGCTTHAFSLEICSLRYFPSLSRHLISQPFIFTFGHNIIIIGMVKLILFLASLLAMVSSRYFETSFKFSLFGRNKGWIYVDKMTFAPGVATIEFETRTSGLPYGRNSQLFLTAITQQRWEKQSIERCQNPVRMPLAVHQLTLDGATTTSTFSFELQQYTTVYFVMKDCQSRFLSEYNNNNLDLHLKLHLLNNGREVGEQEDHWYIVPLIVISGLAVVQYYLNQFRKSNNFIMDWPKMLLFVGTVTQVSSLFWKTIGYVIYHYTGADYFLFHLIYLLLHSTSESAIIALVTLIGFGWTLTFKSGQYFDVFVPLVGCLGVVNIILTMITKLGHEHDRHHVFDSIGGSILTGYRLVISLVFIGGCIYTFRSVRINLKKFLCKFGVLGWLYIASMPLVVLVANYSIHPQNRNEFVFICIEIIKFTTNMILTYEMNYNDSEYNRVNYSNASFLPEEEVGFR